MHLDMRPDRRYYDGEGDGTYSPAPLPIFSLYSHRFAQLHNFWDALEGKSPPLDSPSIFGALGTQTAKLQSGYPPRKW